MKKDDWHDLVFIVVLGIILSMAGYWIYSGITEIYLKSQKAYHINTGMFGNYYCDEVTQNKTEIILRGCTEGEVIVIFPGKELIVIERQR